MNSMDKEDYNKLKKMVENELRMYHYYIMAIQMPGLGSPVRWDSIINKGSSQSSPVEKGVLDYEYQKSIVSGIEYVFDRLDDTSKKIIESVYFIEDTIKTKDIQSNLLIDKNKYTKLKKSAIDKFIVVLANIIQ